MGEDRQWKARWVKVIVANVEQNIPVIPEVEGIGDFDNDIPTIAKISARKK